MRRLLFRYGRRLAFGLLATVLFLLLAEGVVRLFGWGLLPQEKVYTDVYDPNYRLLPGAPNPYSPVREFVNGLGFRGRAFTGPKPAGYARIISAGDSNAFGWNRRLEDTYTYMMEQILRARDEPVECMNGAVPGTWLWPQIVLIRDELFPKFRPDILVLYTGPTFRADTYLEQEMRRGRAPIWNLQRTLARSHLYRLFRHTIRPPRFEDLLTQYFPKTNDQGERIVTNEQLRRPIREDLIELRSLCNQYRVKCLVIPRLSADLFRDARAKNVHVGDPAWLEMLQADSSTSLLSSLLPELGMNCLNLCDGFLEPYYHENLFHDPIHFNVAGHQLAARLISDELCRLGWLPRPCQLNQSR